jgi:large subunit ribosomal protein L27
MAHKKGQGSCHNGRDSNPQHRGFKVYGGEKVQPGSIILRQLGSRFRAGRNVKMGKDYTLFSLIEGTLTIQENGRIHVEPAAASTPATTAAAGGAQ